MEARDKSRKRTLLSEQVYHRGSLDSDPLVEELSAPLQVLLTAISLDYRGIERCEKKEKLKRQAETLQKTHLVAGAGVSSGLVGLGSVGGEVVGSTTGAPVGDKLGLSRK